MHHNDVHRCQIAVVWVYAAKAYLHTKYWTPSCAPLCFPRDGSSHSTPTHSPAEEEGRGERREKEEREMGEGRGGEREGRGWGAKKDRGRAVERRGGE